MKPQRLAAAGTPPFSTRANGAALSHLKCRCLILLDFVFAIIDCLRSGPCPLN